ncbi:PREDICTED: tigger transposable element-derived protein 2-like [Habropoda laboriosa]|uniref:tigger transposable element-derived protein 2-like n=1 Tax=Habropoda laboriosa TaxID=597456 RepID=UPI00083CD290|nr:PREDICTED: tigger transposable element-derived protein 2-like [Habropoda laboriosa]
MSNKQKKPNTVLTLQQRLDILEKLRKGISMSILSKEYGVHVQTIRRIKAKETEIEQRMITFNTGNRKTIRRPVLEELDTRLYTWFSERRVLGDRITDALLQSKASELCSEYSGVTTFTASKGWIWRFKKRYNIRLANIQGDSADPDGQSAETFIQRFMQRVEEEDINLDHIYNMNETGLLWKAIPQKILIGPTEQKVFNIKIKKDRVNIGLCVNATGTHKLLPLFVHEYERPKALKHVKIHELPVVYKYQKNAWIDSVVFANWLENHFKHEVKKHQIESETCGKILLLIDNCKSHYVQTTITKLKDDNIEVIFLPKICTSILQPMDQGIIAKLKGCFRYQLLKKILDFPHGIMEFYLDYDIVDCINILQDAWTVVSSENIRNSWKKLLQEKVMVEDVHDGDAQDYTSEVSNIAETVQRISQQPTAETEIAEWLSTCEEAENQMQNNEDVKPESNTNCNLVPTEEEIDNSFANLCHVCKCKLLH